MTVCNMTIEGGGRAGMIAPDETTFEWVIGRPGAPVRGPRRVARRCSTDDGRRRSTARSSSTPPRSARWSPGAPTRGWSCRSPRRVPEPQLRAGRAGARVHGARGRHADPGDQARPRVHRLVHELADRRPARRGGGDRRAARSPTASTRWSCRARSRSRCRPSARASTRCSGAPASTGAAPAARCAWA